MTAPAPMLSRRRIVSAVVESTPGTAVTLTAAGAAMNCYDATCQPEIEFDEREAQSSFSPLPSTVGGYGGSLTFKTDLIGNSTLPLWASTLLPACGLVATSSVFGPVTNPPGVGGVTTVTIGLFEDGILKSLRGAMGNMKIDFEAGKSTKAEFEFKGVWVPPVVASLVTPTYPTARPIRFASAGLALGSFTPQLQKLSINLGNEIQLREDANDPSGYASAIIAGRRITGSMDPQSVLPSSFDTYGTWLAMTTGALGWSMGATGNGMAFAMPYCQLVKVQEADRNKVQTDNVDFLAVGSAGDDEFSITFT